MRHFVETPLPEFDEKFFVCELHLCQYFSDPDDRDGDNDEMDKKL